MAILRLKIGSYALSSLTAHAAKGLEALYKREVGGHLLGYQDKDGFYVSRAIPYNTPYASRTAWGINQYYFRKKGLRLQTKRLKWIGTYHSHVEINRAASTGQSGEDKEAHLFFEAPVDIIVRIATYRMRAPKVCLSYGNELDGHVYYYDICGYVKDPQEKIMRVTVECAVQK